MKKITLLVTLALGIAFTGCEKDRDDQTSECFRVKIIDQVCNTVVLQIMDSDHYSLGVNGYVKDGIRYDHVFATTLSCEEAQAYANLKYKEGSVPEFYVRLGSKNPEDDCVSCSATLPNPPGKFHSIVMSDCKVQTQQGN